jgi:hypothetical protein
MKSPKPATDNGWKNKLNAIFEIEQCTIESYGKVEISYINVDNF